MIILQIRRLAILNHFPAIGESPMKNRPYNSAVLTSSVNDNSIVLLFYIEVKNGNINCLFD